MPWQYRQIKIRKGAKIILQKTNIRFDHGIGQAAQAETHFSESDLKEKPHAEKEGFTKTLGGTTYKVYVHFSRTGENFEDKILNMLESGAIDIAWRIHEPLPLRQKRRKLSERGRHE